MKKMNFELLTFCFILLFIALRVYALEFAGRIYTGTKKEVVPNLVVKLKPPKVSQKPERLTKTDEEGKFIIKDLDSGKYLFEIYEATTIIYREVIELDKDSTKEIELEKKQDK